MAEQKTKNLQLMAELKTNTYNLWRNKKQILTTYGGTNSKYTKLLWRDTNKIQRNDKRDTRIL